MEGKVSIIWTSTGQGPGGKSYKLAGGEAGQRGAERKSGMKGRAGPEGAARTQGMERKGPGREALRI